MRVAQNISYNRASALTNSVLDDFYEILRKKISELGLENKPQSIFNADETGFMCSPGERKIFVEEGQKVFKV